MSMPDTSTVAQASSRNTRAEEASRCLSAAIAFAAWCSSAKATTPFITNSTAMITASVQCRAASDNTSAASIIHGIGAQKYPKNTSSGLRRSSAISLGP